MMTPPDKSAANRTSPSNPAQAGLPHSPNAGSARLVRVFISSTAEDLREHRAAVRDAAIGAEVMPIMMEYFVASGDKPPLSACLDRVSEVDVLVVIVAHRYGWVPSDQDAGQYKSITWLECERAIDDGKEVLAFLVDEEHPWPSEKTELHRLNAAMQAGTADNKLFREVKRNVDWLKKFKAWLNSRGIRATFTTSDQLRRCVSDALQDWRRRHPTSGSPVDTLPSLPAEPGKYLRELRESSGWIDIRGLQIGTGRTNRFPIEQLYISLTSSDAERVDEREKTGRGKRKTAGDERLLQEPRDRPLQAALRHDRLVVVGAPGGGKTTFLRRICHTLCQTELGEVPQAAEERLEIADRTFPVFIRINALAEHIIKHEAGPEAPAGETARWLPHYLASVSGDSCWGLDADYFQQQLEEGRCTVLLDGLDEAPRRAVRERMSRVIRNVTSAYEGSRFVVTSRPAAYTGEVVLAGFAHAHIDPLSDEAVATFLSRWCDQVYPDSEGSARAHCDELSGAVRGRVEIRRMARNPVMLTALAVVHWNERRLPEQRADLYDSIITWLSRSREQREGRATAEDCVVRLQELALAMQNAPEGRQTQVTKRWAAEQLAIPMGGNRDQATIALAETFLDEEEVDSGIVVGRGNELAYWHLTFQEFLAAKAIASRLDADQYRLLFDNGERVYQSEWREVVLLLCGVLHEHGKAKVDALTGKILDGLGSSGALADQARCVGLIGAILRDLSPKNYKIRDPRYPGLQSAVMAIFDREQSREVALEERIAAADALGQSRDPRLDMEREDYWADIPGGSFLMGAQSKDLSQPNYDPQAYDRESPVHEVSLGGYRIARYPITVGQYQRFLEDEGYQDRRWWEAGGFGKYTEPEDWEEQIEYPSRPVVGVSWWESAAFCAWSECRLPTEAEWEFAARGTTGRKYPWGNEEPDESRTNYGLKVGHATPVGIFPGDVTAEGVLDLGGNVWEWCWDGYDSYRGESVKNPSGADDATDRVGRGGSWFGGPSYCRSAYRFGDAPGFRSLDLGFRPARSSAQSSPVPAQRQFRERSR